MTQHRALACCEYSRDPPSFSTDAAVADLVNTLVKTMKLPSIYSGSNGPSSHPALDELRSADDPMLPPCQFRDRLIPRTSRQFCPHQGPF
jgi:hypothetical protein